MYNTLSNPVQYPVQSLYKADIFRGHRGDFPDDNILCYETEIMSVQARLHTCHQHQQQQPVLTGVEEGDTAAGRQRHVALALQVAVALRVVAEVAQGTLVVVEAAPLSGTPGAQLRAALGDLRQYLDLRQLVRVHVHGRVRQCRYLCRTVQH